MRSFELNPIKLGKNDKTVEISIYRVIMANGGCLTPSALIFTYFLHNMFDLNFWMKLDIEKMKSLFKTVVNFKLSVTLLNFN